MSHQTVNGINQEAVKKFCHLGVRHNKDEFQRWFSYVLRELKKDANVTNCADYEFSADRYLRKEFRQEDIVKFLELERALEGNKIIKKKKAIVQFLVRVCEEKKSINGFGSNRGSNSENCPMNEDGVPVTPKSSLQQERLSLSPVIPPVLNQDINEKNMTAKGSSRRDSLAETVISSGNRTWARAQEGDGSERAILQELLFAFQGIGGEIFKDDFGDGSFRISTRISAPLRQHAAYLAELGTLHVFVRRMVDAVPMVGSPTCLSALVTAMRLQLNEFCRLISQLEAQLHQDGGSPLTLLRVRVITGTSQIHMRWLATVAEMCKDKKGGALLSALYVLMHHGDPKVQAWLEPLLAAASRPYYEMLGQWLKEGRIDDPYAEFFVTVDSAASGDNFWFHKFSIRETMRPSFISMSQVNLILATGKSVAFLRDLCDNVMEMKWAGLDAALSTATNVNAHSLWAVDGELQACIESAHREISKRALAVMLNEGKLSVHLQALRRYLLLGQGDFVRQLMENLAPYLNKPASNLYTHQLTPLLDSAIRTTNAQYEEQDVLARLDVKLMQMSPGELGWDVFTLQYCVDGPIAMIFSNEASTKYLCLFNALWRAKRMEWVLTNIWKYQTTTARLLRNIPELQPVLRETHLLVAEMNQLVRQMQYYLLFESVECQWSELQQAVAQAPSLDDLICAHDRFLSNVMRRALLDESSAPLLTQLRSVYNSVLQLQSIEKKLSERAGRELERRMAVQREAERLEKAGEYGSSIASDETEERARKEFKMNIKAIQGELRSLASSYQEMVKLFLLALASQTNEDLQFLSYRLDFNEYYKNSDKRLSTPCTLNFRRRSVRPGVPSPLVL